MLANSNLTNGFLTFKSHMGLLLYCDYTSWEKTEETEPVGAIFSMGPGAEMHVTSWRSATASASGINSDWA